ncbi:hypothetical protein [Leptothermofonsia sp. ETS-13]|uniref:hypothetical protein n=1 Tax=Leptothermofonsia sp. ETS-13 TaxID=3035696 RepID=UPI003B9DFCBE
MTSQTLTADRSISASVATALVSIPEAASSVDPRQSRLLEAMKTQYRLDQQVKFLHLQAETESLLQQLKAIKQQRQASEPPSDTADK